jgi:chromate reductase
MIKTFEEIINSEPVFVGSFDNTEDVLNNFCVDVKKWIELLQNSIGFIVISGTYWNNIGSPLQRFIEVFTPLENSKEFFGKPVSAIVSMDSAGGMNVAQQIHWAFGGLGCWSPPCSSVIISRTGLELVYKDSNKDKFEDVWRLEDIDVLAENFIIACQNNNQLWKSWPHEKYKLTHKSYPEKGDIDMGNEVFINRALTEIKKISKSKF